MHGVLLLDKPLGLSSNNALQKCKWLLRAEKAGHTGTLDPLATGVLPLCFGAATKFAQLPRCRQELPRHAGARRAHRVRATARRQSSSAATSPWTAPPSTPACRRFTGAIDQVPPMHSALKKDGKALYDYARAGVEVERAPRGVTIHRIDVVAWHGSELVLDVSCSKGTYIRTLGEDIGEALGCGAHLAALRRTGAGSSTCTDASRSTLWNG